MEPPGIDVNGPDLNENQPCSNNLIDSSSPSAPPGFESLEAQFDRKIDDNNEESKVVEDANNESPAEMDGEQVKESELKDATETWLGGKTLVLSTSNEADAIEAIMEERRTER